MPYTIKEAIYSKENPLEADSAGGGKLTIVSADSPDANFRVAGAGAVLSDADAEKYGVTGRGSNISDADLRSESEKANAATHQPFAPFVTPEIKPVTVASARK